MSEEDNSMNLRSNLSSFFKILSSYNSNVLLAALVFLLLVVLFVLLLHFYARFFWSPSHQDISAARRHRRRRRNRRRTITTTRIIPSIPLGGFDSGVTAPTAASNDDKGLESSVISSIPLFVYEEDEEDEEEEEEEECVICLGLWEVGDFGRKLRNCGHGFHVECIDMWLSSHSTCPLCRSPVLAISDEDKLKTDVNAVEEEEEEEEVRMQLSPAGEDDRRFSLSLAVMEDDLKTGVDDGDGEGEVRIEVFDEEINGVGSRSDRRSMSMTSSASSSFMRMLSSSSSRSERNKVFPSARPYPEALSLFFNPIVSSKTKPKLFTQLERIRCRDECDHTMGNQTKARMDRVSDEVAKLFNKVVALEGDIQGGIGVEDKEFLVLIELLMMQILKLDEIEAEGELKVQRKREVCRVQSIVESLDKLRARNRDMNRSATPQELPLPRSRSICFSFPPKTSTIITQQWELFD